MFLAGSAELAHDVGGIIYKCILLLEELSQGCASFDTLVLISDGMSLGLNAQATTSMSILANF